MHYQMSSASAPGLVPQPTPAQPVTAKPVPKPPSRKGLWIGVLVVLLAAAATLYWARTSTAPAQGKGGPVSVRTAVVAKAAIQHTIRLTGTTGAEKYVALVAPQLRGRGQGRREGRTFQSGQNTNSAVQSNASRSSSASGMSSGGAVQSTMGASSGGGSSAFRSATSRVNRSSSASSARSSAGGGTAATSSAGGASGLGSTASELGAGMGGGGGGNMFDFLLVLESMVKPGVFVKKGDVVAEFDRQNMMLRVDDFRASVAQTEASFKKFLAELELGKAAHQQTIEAAKADLEKARLDIKTIPVLSAIEAERARLALEEAEAKYKQLLAEVKLVEAGMAAQVRNAEIDVQQARIDLRRAEANADRMLVKAPIDGLAVAQTTFRGSEFAQIQEGDQVFPGMMFMQIVDPRSMIINAAINQVDVERLRIGQKAKVKFDAYPGLELEAHVYSIGAITRTGGARAQYVKEIPIKLKLDTMDPRVIPDLSVSADVVLDAEPEAPVTSLASVFSDNEGRTNYVFVKSGEAWERRAVELGLADNLRVAVKSGLQPGEVVALERPPQKQAG